LNTPNGLFDVTKLQNFPITSSYSLAFADTESVYRVDPPPTSVDPNAPELWLYGKRNANNVYKVDGDLLVPGYSGDLTQVVGYGNINAFNEEAFNPSETQITHFTIPNHPFMVRRVNSYLTGLTIPESFWDIEKGEVSYAEWDVIWAVVSCSPVRLLATDPLGRQAGLDLNTGEIINEIPGAFVGKDGDEPQLILLPEVVGQYQVQGIGVTDGFYTIGALRLDKDANPFVVRALTGTTTIGQSYDFTFDVASAPVYLPVIFKEASGQIMAVPLMPESSTFNSPLPVPTPTLTPVTIESLITTLDTIYQQGQIDQQDIYHSLGNKLEQTQRHLDQSKPNQAINRLEAFIRQVENQRGKHVTPEAADLLTTMAQQLIVEL
jgi:hypothetical protein